MHNPPSDVALYDFRYVPLFWLDFGCPLGSNGLVPVIGVQTYGNSTLSAQWAAPTPEVEWAQSLGAVGLMTPFRALKCRCS